MPQQEYDTCTGCGRQFHMKTEWVIYLGHICSDYLAEVDALNQNYEY
jgi:predicted Fe-S protein YdhL (DUF1289 family)